MSSQIGKLVRRGLMAVGLLAAVAAPAAAAPLARGAVPPVETSGALNPILVQEGGSGRWSACTRDGRNCAEHPNWRRDGLRYDRRAWRDGRRNWEHQWQRPRWQHRDRRWDRRDWRMHHRPYRFHRAPVIQFNLGSPGYRYVDPYYEAPRRYVVRLSAAHVEYCRSRYKSYRLSDNSWKPYHGPRRQCLSPYS